MTLCSELLRGMGESGELFLVHRLDRVTGGALAFARTKVAAAELSKLMADGGLNKCYFAVCFGEAKEGLYEDFLYKDSSLNKAFVVKGQRNGVKHASLYCMPLSYRDGKTLVCVKLNTGRFHQIRAQLSSRKNPLVGDKKYGGNDPRAKTPALFASRLAFSAFGKRISVSVLPPINEYPWNLFDISAYDGISKISEGD